jgi:predicted nucleotidyltransferase
VPNNVDTRSKDRGINPTPTQFPELNAVLRGLTERAHAILGDNFVGAYLQGSFAVGDADMASDCDFLIPVNGPITAEQEAALRALHREIVTRPGHWTHHLEGSYPDRAELRTLDALSKEWLYIDHGHAEMEWSTHCNSEVVRWSLRECGVTLLGPDPKTLVDEVGPEILRAKMRASVGEFLPALATWTSLDIAWSQRYAVTTFCRILHTLDTGRVTSKRAALLWAKDRLDPKWSALIQQTIDGRAEYWADPTPPGAVQETLAFAEYAKSQAASWPEPK